MNIGEKIKKLRCSLNMSQQELAEKMGYTSRSSINKIESGRPVSQKIIVRLADALYTTPSYLMGWEEENEEQKLKIDSRLLEIFGNNEFSNDEIDEIVNFTKYLLSKRK